MACVAGCGFDNKFTRPASDRGRHRADGCGTGKAIHDLRESRLVQRPELNVAFLFIDSDKDRYQQATETLTKGKSGGTALSSAIEDATVDRHFTVYFVVEQPIESRPL